MSKAYFYNLHNGRSDLETSVPLSHGPVWAREHCRISALRFLAECRKRRLNQASFVLLYFAFFCAMFSFCSVFLIWLLSCIFQRVPSWMAF